MIEALLSKRETIINNRIKILRREVANQIVRFVDNEISMIKNRNVRLASAV